MCRWGWILGKLGYGRACMMLRCHGWGWNPPLTASHIHIGCIQSFSKDAVDECITTVNGTLVIPHPMADDQPKCVVCKTAIPYTWWCQRILLREKNMNSTSATPACLSQKWNVRFILTIRWVADVWLYDMWLRLTVNRARVKKGKRKDRGNVQQEVWYWSQNWTTLVGNDEGVDDLACFYLLQMYREGEKEVCYWGMRQISTEWLRWTLWGTCGDEKNRKRRKSI